MSSKNYFSSFLFFLYITKLLEFYKEISQMWWQINNTSRTEAQSLKIDINYQTPYLSKMNSKRLSWKLPWVWAARAASNSFCRRSNIILSESLRNPIICKSFTLQEHDHSSINMHSLHNICNTIADNPLKNRLNGQLIVISLSMSGCQHVFNFSIYEMQRRMRDNLDHIEHALHTLQSGLRLHDLHSTLIKLVCWTNQKFLQTFCIISN